MLKSIAGLSPSGKSPVTILYTWVERDNVGQSSLSKETTPWQGLGVEPTTPTIDPWLRIREHQSLKFLEVFCLVPQLLKKINSSNSHVYFATGLFSG